MKTAGEIHRRDSLTAPAAARYFFWIGACVRNLIARLSTLDGFMQSGELVAIGPRRFNLERIVKARDRRETCPRCWEPMRYRRVEGSMKKWSPGPYAWFCSKCPVVKLDGTIVPGEETWDSRMQQDEKSRLSDFLSAALRGSIKATDGKNGKKK